MDWMKFWYFISLLLVYSSFANASSSYLIEGEYVKVTEDDFQAYLKSKVPEKYQYEVMTEATAIEKLARQLYKRRVLEKEAYKLRLDKKPEIQQLLSRAVSSVLVNARLRLLAEEEEDLVNWDLVAKEEYHAYLGKYRTPETVHISHILISREKHEERELKQIAEKVLMLLASSSNRARAFEKLAEQFSEDPSAKNGGDLGFIKHGQMVDPFEKAAFKLHKPGELSPIVETKFGLHIIKLNKRNTARKIPFAQVKNQIIEKKKQTRRARLIDKHVESIFVNATTHRDVIKSLQKPYNIDTQ